MPDFTAALGDALCGRYRFRELRSTTATRTGVKARMGRLMKAYGGDRRAAARAAGIPYSSWGKMLSGKHKIGTRNLGRLEAAYTRLIVSPLRSGIIAKRGYPKMYEIDAVVVADPKRSRYINGQPPGLSEVEAARFTTAPEHRTFRAKLGPAESQAVVDAWLSGGGPLDDEAAAGALLTAIDREHGPFAFEGNTVGVTLHGRQ